MCNHESVQASGFGCQTWQRINEHSDLQVVKTKSVHIEEGECIGTPRGLFRLKEMCSLNYHNIAAYAYKDVLVWSACDLLVGFPLNSILRYLSVLGNQEQQGMMIPKEMEGAMGERVSGPARSTVEAPAPAVPRYPSASGDAYNPPARLLSNLRVAQQRRRWPPFHPTHWVPHSGDKLLRLPQYPTLQYGPA